MQGIEQAAEHHSVVYDPSSNGATENACKQVGGFLRALKSDLEERWDRAIPVDHPLFDWLAEHASWILTTKIVAKDGKTPHQLARRC